MMKTQQKKHVLENFHMTEELEKILSNLSDAGCGSGELKKAKQKLQNWQKEWGINSADTVQTMLTSPGNYTWQNKTNTKIKYFIYCSLSNIYRLYWQKKINPKDI